MSEIKVVGSVFGKEASVTPTSKLRALMPMPAVMQVIDVVIASKINDFVDATLPTHSGAWIGAVPRTQPLDITHGLQSVIEKSLDDHSRGCIAQADIEKYYDSLPVLRVVRWLDANGLELAWCAAALRHQLLPKVSLRTSNSITVLGSRSAGSLTGTRVAGALGRVSVEEALIALADPLMNIGFPGPGGARLTIATYVDNMFSASVCPRSATSMLQLIEARLLELWVLHIKPESRVYMVA